MVIKNGALWKKLSGLRIKMPKKGVFGLTWNLDVYYIDHYASSKQQLYHFEINMT